LLRSIADVLKYCEDSGTFFEQSVHLMLFDGTDAEVMGSVKAAIHAAIEVVRTMAECKVKDMWSGVSFSEKLG
jgi:hypothetical protein